MKRKRFITLLLFLCLLVTSFSQAAFADEDDWYTYTYSYWNEETASPNAYTVTNNLYGMNIDAEIGNFKMPESIFCIDDLVFVVDTGNNRIVELQKVEGKYELVRLIYDFSISTLVKDESMYCGFVADSLAEPYDIFVKKTTNEDRLATFGEYLGEKVIVTENDRKKVAEAAAAKKEEDKKKTTETTEGGEGEKTEGGEGEKTEGGEETAEAGSSSASVILYDETPDLTAEAPEDGETAEGGEDIAVAEPAPTAEGDSTPAAELNVTKKELNRDYDFYITDRLHNRIIHCDYQLNVIRVISNPEGEVLPDNYVFRPTKCVTDIANRTYVQSDGDNSGLMEFDTAGDFVGYIGANKVLKGFWAKLRDKLRTEEQRKKMKRFVPTEYNNISLDKDGFIFGTISALKDLEITEGTATPVRKLNSMGNDILIRNGNNPPCGDVSFGKAEQINGASRFVDVIPFDNGTYCCLDTVRGKLFTYDFQGNLLYAFGNTGYIKGCFTKAISMDNIDEKTIVVLDKQRGTITEFTMTDYGVMIDQALNEYSNGHYDESAEIWEQVLQYNGNYELAYVGIGRALLRKGEFKEAMRYFESAHDDENYSKAFKHYREEVVEKYILYAVIVIAALIIIPKLVRGIKKLRKEIREA